MYAHHTLIIIREQLRKTPDTSALHTHVYTYEHICLQHSTYTDTYAHKYIQSLMMEGCTELYHRFLVTLRVQNLSFCIHAEFYRTVSYYQQIVRSSYSGILDSSHSPHLPVAPTNSFLITLPPPDSQQLCICVLLACLCGFAPAAHSSFPLCHLDVSFPFTLAFPLPTL